MSGLFCYLCTRSVPDRCEHRDDPLKNPRNSSTHWIVRCVQAHDSDYDSVYDHVHVYAWSTPYHNIVRPALNALICWLSPTYHLLLALKYSSAATRLGENV